MLSKQMRMTEIVGVGILSRDPVRTPDGRVHFLLDAMEGSTKPFQCICEGKAGDNLVQYCKAGDEVTIEGELRWWQFRNETSPRLLIYVRFISYGRKGQSLRPEVRMD